MSKDPAFLFYYQDFLVGTSFMSLEEIGGYIKILCFLADKQTLSEEEILQKIPKQIWEKLVVKFIKTSSGCYYNKRLRDELEKRKNYSKSRRNNLLGKKNTQSHMDRHMENVNVNVNKDLNDFKSNISNKINDNDNDDINVLSNDDNNKYNIKKYVEEIITYLNSRAKTNYSTTAKTNTAFIKARLNEGRTVEDFKKVIDLKCDQWLTDETMCRYLRPETLFNATKFESYLNEKRSVSDEIRNLLK